MRLGTTFRIFTVGRWRRFVTHITRIVDDGARIRGRYHRAGINAPDASSNFEEETRPQPALGFNGAHRALAPAHGHDWL